MDGPGVYKLIDPIRRSDKEEPITELTLQLPRAKHMRGMTKDPTSSQIFDVLSKLTGQPESVIDELSARDFTKIVDLLAPFF